MYRRTARDVMTSEVVTVQTDRTLAEAARLMLDRNVSCLPVVDADGRLVGMITHTNFTAQQRHLPFSETPVLALVGELTSPQEIMETYRAVGGLTVGQAMVRDAITVGPDDAVGSIVAKMVQHDIKRLPVVEAGRLVGIVTRHDLLKLVADARPAVP